MTSIRDVPGSNLDQNTEYPEALVVILQGYTNPVRQFIRTTQICTLAPHLYGSSLWSCFISPYVAYNLECLYLLGMAPIFCTPGFTEVLEENLGYYLKLDHANLSFYIFTVPLTVTRPDHVTAPFSYPTSRSFIVTQEIPRDPTYLLFHSCVAVRPYVTFATYFQILKLQLILAFFFYSFSCHAAPAVIWKLLRRNQTLLDCFLSV